MDLKRGKLIGGKYRLERSLDAGGMGQIWIAHSIPDNIDVAIKLMAANLQGAAQAEVRFKQEAKAESLLQSRHIIQVLDFGVHEGAPYMVMELLNGKDLGSVLEEQKRLTLKRASEILNQIAEGLQEAHDHGIIHRDLKPKNIYLHHSGGEEIVKILDFGIAKMTGPSAAETETGIMLGSPSYVSPEQAYGQKIDHRTDLWSLGVVLFQTIAGEQPFKGRHIVDTLTAICTGPIRPPSRVMSTLPPEVDRFFESVLVRDREKRFPSVRVMAEAFAKIAEVYPEVAAPPPKTDSELKARPKSDRGAKETVQEPVKAAPLPAAAAKEVTPSKPLSIRQPAVAAAPPVSVRGEAAKEAAAREAAAREAAAREAAAKEAAAREAAAREAAAREAAAREAAAKEAAAREAAAKEAAAKEAAAKEAAKEAARAAPVIESVREPERSPDSISPAFEGDRKSLPVTTPVAVMTHEPDRKSLSVTAPVASERRPAVVSERRPLSVTAPVASERRPKPAQPREMERKPLPVTAPVAGVREPERKPVQAQPTESGEGLGVASVTSTGNTKARPRTRVGLRVLQGVAALVLVLCAWLILRSSGSPSGDAGPQPATSGEPDSGEPNRVPSATPSAVPSAEPTVSVTATAASTPQIVPPIPPGPSAIPTAPASASAPKPKLTGRLPQPSAKPSTTRPELPYE